MFDNWSPYREAEEHLNRYNHFFKRNDAMEKSEHPQILEDYLNEVCPRNYCYVWIYKNLWERERGTVGDLIGVPEEIALAIKLKTGVNIFHLDDFDVRKGFNGKFGLERKCLD